MTLIRPIERVDHDQWLSLWERYNAFYGRVGETALPDDITHVTWERFFDVDEPLHAIVAGVEGRLVGIAHYLYHRSTIGIAPVCYLQDLFTAEWARGQGVGQKLIEAVYLEARKAGAGRVYWQTHETNLTAQGLYDKVAERSGFIVYRHLF